MHPVKVQVHWLNGASGLEGILFYQVVQIFSDQKNETIWHLNGGLPTYLINIKK